MPGWDCPKLPKLDPALARDCGIASVKLLSSVAFIEMAGMRTTAGPGCFPAAVRMSSRGLKVYSVLKGSWEK